MRALLACIAALALVASCAEREPARETRGALYFRVQSSDPGTVARLRCVRVLLRRSEGAAPHMTMRNCFRGTGRSAFPGVFAVTRDPAVDGPAVHVEVITELTGGAEFAQRASMRFAERRALLAVFDLHAGCVGVVCPAGRTCGGDGTCSVPIERGELPDFDPAFEPRSADLEAPTLDDAAVGDAVADVLTTTDAPATEGGTDAAGDATDACRACDEDGRCTELASDPRHCGACDQRCGVREGCAAGRCVPVQPAGITAAGDRTCVWMSDGTARCWGLNSMGALGGTTGAEVVPRALRVVGFRAVSQLAAADHTTCALTEGRVVCVGAPIAGVSDLTDARAIAMGRGFLCALSAAGGVRCTGSNAWGQLGDGSTTDRSSPVDVTGVPSGATAITAGYLSACAVAGGRVACWGMNTSGQLGGAAGTHRCEGGLACRPEAVVVDTLDGVEQLATLGLRVSRGLVGGVPQLTELGATCALDRTRAVRCWGQSALAGIGPPTTSLRDAPGSPIPSLRAMDVRLGLDFACALEEGGTVACWGVNSACQTGDASGSARVFSPTRVPGLADVRAVALGIAHACALRTDGEVLCWGANAQGQLAQDGTSASSCRPLSVRW